jgi:RNA polymerase sigma factor (sigma-70 family)
LRSPVRSDDFPITRHSVLIAMRSDDPGQRSQAIEVISAAYWKPIYKYVRLKWNLPREDAQDFTQEFLLRLIEKEFLASFDPAKARLRTFMRLCADRLFLNHSRDAQRQKRNGGAVIALDFDEAEQEFRRRTKPTSPEEYFEKECVRHLLALAVERLRTKCESSGKTVHFSLFHEYDLDRESEIPPSYSQLAAKHQLAATDVTNYLAWARREFRAYVLQQLREMSASDEEFRREAKAILGISPK